MMLLALFISVALGVALSTRLASDVHTNWRSWTPLQRVGCIILGLALTLLPLLATFGVAARPDFAIYAASLVPLVVTLLAAARGRVGLLIAEFVWVLGFYALYRWPLPWRVMTGESGPRSWNEHENAALIAATIAGLVLLSLASLVASDRSQVVSDTDFTPTLDTTTSITPFPVQVSTAEVARHEAAHAVVGHALGGTVLGIRLGHSPETSSGGCCLVTFADTPRFADHPEHKAHAEGVYAMAGAVASGRASIGASADVAVARNSALAMADLDETQIGDRIETCLSSFETEARKLLDKNQLAWDILADVLFAAHPGFLTRNQIAPYLEIVRVEDEAAPAHR